MNYFFNLEKYILFIFKTLKNAILVLYYFFVISFFILIFYLFINYFFYNYFDFILIDKNINLIYLTDKDVVFTKSKIYDFTHINNIKQPLHAKPLYTYIFYDYNVNCYNIKDNYDNVTTINTNFKFNNECGLKTYYSRSLLGSCLNILWDDKIAERKFKPIEVKELNYNHKSLFTINLKHKYEPSLKVFKNTTLNFKNKIEYVLYKKTNFYLYLQYIITFILHIICIIVPVLLSVALLTLVERKIMSAIQRRRGPNIIGFFGLLQPFADGLKLLVKEFNIPKRSFDSLVLITPMLSLMFTCACFSVVPFSYSYLSFSTNNISALYIMAISSLNIYSIIMAGWASKSVYAFLGSLRAAAQFISYEVSLTLNIMSIFIISNSLDLSEIMYIQEETMPNIFIVFPIFLLFLVGIISETNRTPFDLAEAESELVAGYGVEFSAAGFAFFFIAEYGSIILYCMLTLCFFFSGNFLNLEILKETFFLEIFSDFSFGLSIIFVLFFFCFVRATYARYRFDQLMKLNWKNLLLISLFINIYIVVIIYIVNLNLK